jgi:hypothetical protein
MDDKERGFHARGALDSIRNVANYLGNIRGRRKAVVLFGEGIDYNINEMFSSQVTEAQTVIDATREMIAAATRANVAIYAVDPRGLGAEFEGLAAIQSFPDDTTLGLGMSSIFNEVRLSQDSLRVMGEETGGFAVVNRNDFGSAFQRIVDDNSSYYVMGYYSTNDKRDGRFRKIEVRLQDRPGYIIRARKGYVAPRGKAPEARAASKDGASPELTADGIAAGGHGRGVQRTGAEGLGRDRDVYQWQHAAVRGQCRDVQERSRGPRHCDRRQGQDLHDRSQHGEPEHETGYREARDGYRIPRHSITRTGAGTLQPPRRGPRGQHAQSRLGHDGPRGPGFLEAAADDERHRGDIGAERRGANHPPEGSAREAPARTVDDLSRVHADG